MEFQEDGKLKFERVKTIITDTTDGYLSNLEGVTYSPEDSGGGLFGITHKDLLDEEDIDEVGSYLLKNLSDLHNILIDVTVKQNTNQHKDDPLTEEELEELKDEALHRANKKVGQISKLSDKYQMEDDYYRQYYHEDIISICQAIRECYDG